VKVLFLQSVKKSLLVGISKKAKTSLSKCPYYYLKLKNLKKKYYHDTRYPTQTVPIKYHNNLFIYFLKVKKKGSTFTLRNALEGHCYEGMLETQQQQQWPPQEAGPKRTGSWKKYFNHHHRGRKPRTHSFGMGWIGGPVDVSGTMAQFYKG